ncbi:hypothetical protein PR202_ga05533 [Eleusine coracana subsp. coracana]|uniref:Cysteine-rich receptor-like protein kinase 10 n=1 Tax=Eleusine coracana subsp. coracana TaxID=191504 RepID=A0AAV5BTW7_ELECO|nr:hypothetical protein PR202_ga05080 [Eleusine coracana subsp. coracana]GJM89347.1 hypothetical protein PR202_ga05533 [Eleusine coracana subsp. coracana]
MSSLLAFLLLSSFILAGAPANAEDPDYTDCPSDTNYTRGSAFEANLNALLSSLPAAALASSGFARDVTGAALDEQAFGLAQCRADVNSSTCRACLDGSVRDMASNCPGQKDAMLIYDKCLLRHSNANFFGGNYRSVVLALVNTKNATQPQFTSTLGTLMGNLREKAAYGTPRMFAAGSATLTPFVSIYGMVQCTRDLAPDDCNLCLATAVGYIPTCCNDKEGARIASRSCSIRFEVYPFYNESAAEAAMSLAPSPEGGPVNHFVPAGSTGSKRTVRTVLLVSIPVAVTLLVVVLIALYLCKRNRKLRKHSKIPSGILQNGQEIAVKRLSTTSQQGQVEMKNEVVLVAKLQHKNLVRILGCCIQEHERLLVYEFLSNNSLDKIIFNPARQHELSWGQRHKIIEGIGRGLLYLHEDSRLTIIHRDLKASNILLDKDMNPKISDFGLAKLFDVDLSVGNTSRIAGTYGYMSPEYALHGMFSTKSDVFSYGVLVLEIITGRRNTHVQESEDLLSFVWRCWRRGSIGELLDGCPTDGRQPQEVLRCVHVGLLCVQEDPQLRPGMASVVIMLNSRSITLPAPTAPAFVVVPRAAVDDAHGSSIDRDGPREAARWPSINYASSVSDLEPR